MFFVHWLNRTSRLASLIRQPRRDRTKERRLKLMRLEQRRVLNADFTFVAGALSLDNVDGDLTVREVSGESSHQIEFVLHGGSVWQNNESTGLYAIDNSTPGHSVLSIAKSDLESLTSGVSLRAASSAFDLQFDVHSSSLDLSQMRGTLFADGFGQIGQTASSDHSVRFGDVSLSASEISLSQFHGDDITLNANEVDLIGGAGSFSGSTLSIHSLANSTIELGGTLDTAHELNFTDSDISALHHSFQRIRFQAHSAENLSSILIDSSGADFREAITSGNNGSLHLTADSVQIDGLLSISGGLIDVTATHDATINDTGSLVSHGGFVRVDAGESGTLLVTGDIDVSNSEPGGVGGTVHLLGEQIGLFGAAEVNASGHSGGGEVLIGGGLHGDNAAIPHADHVFIGHDVEVHADATQRGDGGLVVAWSDEITQVYGTLTARGGVLLGDGGLIETSSHNQLIVTRGGDTSAPNGEAGTWLLDPVNIRIVPLPLPPDIDLTRVLQPPNFTPLVSDSVVTDDAIEKQLATGATVVISTFNPAGMEPGNVTQEASIDVMFTNPGASATFIISAANDILINAGTGIRVLNNSGSLNVVLEANTGADDPEAAQMLGNVSINADIDTNGGFFSSTGVDFDSSTATIMASGRVSITHTGMVDVGVLNTGAGFGGTTFIHGADVNGAITVGEGDVFIDGGNPDLIVNQAITTTDTAFLLADRDVVVRATINVGVGNPLADLSITANADASADGLGGFLLDEDGDARIEAGGNITIVGGALVATADPNDSLVIEADASEPQIVAGQDLTITANFGSLSAAGDIVLDGRLEATQGSLTVFFTGTTFLSADQMAGTDVFFQNAVRLTQDVAVTAGNDLTFASTIDGDGTGRDLALTALGDVLLVGAIGNAAPLANLSVTGDGLIDFLNSVRIDGDLAVTATSVTDRTTFQESVTVGGSVTITNDGLLVIGSQANFMVGGSFTQESSAAVPDGTGSTELGADITTMAGGVTFNQAVLLTEDVTLDSSAANQNITFLGTIDSEVTGANEEQVISLTAAVSFDLSWVPPPLAGGTPIGEATANIPLNATAEQVRDAFVTAIQQEYQAVDPSLTITEADIDVLGDPGGPYTLIFQGAFRGTDVNEVTVSDGSISVLTTFPGAPILHSIIAEHNSLTLIAGTGNLEFQGDIGGTFIDVGLGVDGDQALGDFTVVSAGMMSFRSVDPANAREVTLVATAGSIDFGTDTNVIAGGILIADGTNPITFQSGQNIRINGDMTSEVDLFLLAAGDVTLTDDGSIFTTMNDSTVTIVADTDGNGAGAFQMNAETEINAGAGFIDVRAAEVFLGLLTSTSTNPTDADNPAIRVVATFGAINDINGDELNLVANAPNPDDTEDPGAGVVLDAVRGIGAMDDALETDLAALSAFNHDRPEQQLVTLDNATGGSFTLSWNPPGSATPLDTTDPIPFDATADQVKALFRATFTTLTDADLDVSGNAGGPYLFTFLGALRVTNVNEITASGANLIGVGPTVTTTTVSDPIRAENNIVIRDSGTTAGRVDLIFVHNQANQSAPQFANATAVFTSDKDAIIDGDGTSGLRNREATEDGRETTITFSAATPGLASNDIVINFTVGNETHEGATEGVPIITISDHEITIDLDPTGTTANALLNAINSNRNVNQLIRAFISGTDNPDAPGAEDITSGADGMTITLSDNPAGAENGVIDITVENANLRVVADNSRLVLSEMQTGIDLFDPTDLAVPAVLSENTIKLTALGLNGGGTIEVFDDILAIQPLTQITAAIDATATTFAVVDPTVFAFASDPAGPAAGDFIQINSEIMRVTSINPDGNLLTVVRGQKGTTAVPHGEGTVIANIDSDNGVRGYIDIRAAANFVLAADRVISTDDHYINSLNFNVDLNSNGFVDDVEVNNNNGEDPDRDGESNVDLNGDGILQLRGNKTALAADDDFFSQVAHDVLSITAGLDGVSGRVLLGTASTISTDNGIQQLIFPRPVLNSITNGVFNFQPGTAFFSGDVTVSELASRFVATTEILPDGTVLKSGEVVFLGTLTFTIGAPGEKNLVLEIDWGDHDRTQVSQVPPTTDNLQPPELINGVFVFNPRVDQRATRFLIPEGGATYSIPHEFTQTSFNLKSVDGQVIELPGRKTAINGGTSDPIQVRFAVSQHSSIVIAGLEVVDPSVAPDQIDGAMDPQVQTPQNAAYDNNPMAPTGQGVNFPKESIAKGTDLDQFRANPLFQLSSTNVADEPDFFLPRFDSGVAEFSIPTPPTPPVQRPDVPIPPPPLPLPFIPDNVIITAPQLTTESSRASASSSSVTTDEYFELRRTNEDGTVTAERLNELAGETLLDREKFENFVRELGDGEYEIFFITRDNKDGTTIPRSVIQFRLESGRLAPPANDSPNVFKPFRLIPVPKVPKPDKPNEEDAGAAESPEPSLNEPNPKPKANPMSEEMSGLWNDQPAETEHLESIAVSEVQVAGSATDLTEASAGLLMFVGARFRKSRFKPSGLSLFSRTARMARKRLATTDDQ